MLGLDRKQMEAERLARLSKKRGADQDPVSESKQPRKIQRTSPKPISPPPRSAPVPAPAPALRTAPIPSSAPTTHPRLDDTIIYPTGAIKTTACLRQPCTSHDITLADILGTPTLNIAVLSSWQLDTPWLFSKLDLPRTKLILIMHSKHDEDKVLWRQQAAELSPGIRLCFPELPKGPRGVMHSKVMLLFHPSKLRVVIPSANLMPHDWGETGTMENVLFLIDLPRLPTEKYGDENDTITPFALDLVEYLEAQGLDQDVRDGVLKFDFSRTGHLAFVATVAGTHIESAAKTTGLPALANAIKSLDLATSPGEPFELDYAASSIGLITSRLFPDLFHAFRGVVATGASTSPLPSANSNQHFRIHFPSDATVKSSLGGPAGAGTLFFAPQKTDLQTAPLIRSFRDSQSKRKGVLSHAKMGVLRTAKGAAVYVGSANASQAAWGAVTRDRKTREEKLTAGNWEAGVLVRVDGLSGVEGEGVDAKSNAADGGGEDETGTATTSRETAKRKDAVVRLEALAERVSIPFEIPGEPYVDADGAVKQPWIQRGKSI